MSDVIYVKLYYIIVISISNHPKILQWDFRLKIGQTQHAVMLYILIKLACPISSM